MNELAGQSLGGYQLEEEIGRGSMGMVYRGRQIALGREVAIKVLSQALAKDTSYVARFIREAQIIAGLNHPNIVQIFDAGQQNGLLYFVMEFIQGPTLASLLQLDGSIPHYLAAEYAAQIADALDSAYRERNVIHRDIKPENLMLDRWGKIKVMDFGLARATGHQKITVAKTLVGSIYYASPEQVWGQTLDNRSDIYALGVVLYEMVTGQRPFSGRSLPELTQAIISGPVRPPNVLAPDISQELEQIILIAMSRDRNQRYEQAMLMARDLRSLNLRPVAQETTEPPERFPITPNESRTQPPPRPKVVIHPPKRPQMHIPRYMDLEMTPPPPTEQVEVFSPMPQEPDFAESPTRPTNIPEIDTEGPTGPLGPPSPIERREQRAQKARQNKAQRSFWRKIFKTSAQ
nr:protein kinase [Ktedonobacteraceae bacterium]